MNIKLNNEKGVALILALFIMVVLLGLSTIFVLRAAHESNVTKITRIATKAFYLADAGSQMSLDEMDTLINNYLQNTILNSNPQNIVNYAKAQVTAGDGLVWLQNGVRNNGVQVLTLNGNQAEYTVDATDLAGGTYQIDFIFTEKTDPVTVIPDEVWDFPFNYRAEATGIKGNLSKTVILTGDFTVRVQRDNFAKYALFTNTQTMPSGTNVWFTNKTDFAGPIHTNGRYNIYGNPSGVFDGLAQQHEITARFYNGGSNILLNADLNGAIDVPSWNAGYDRGVNTISLSSPSQETTMIDKAKGGVTTSGNGIFVPANDSNLVGGIYVNGNANVTLSVDVNDNAVYAITQGSTTKNITVDQVNNQTQVETVGGGTQTFNGVPFGSDHVGTLIFVQGAVNSLSGTVQKDTEITVASSNDIIITNHLQYADYAPAVGTPGSPDYVPPSAEDTTNLLGVVSWNGNVRIGSTAPADINVHGTMLAQDGIFQVDNYSTKVPSGTATLLGGAITNNYGAFGTFNGSTGAHVSGYGRNFVYDERMRYGNAPPYFPSLQAFIAFTNDITDKMIWQEG